MLKLCLSGTDTTVWFENSSQLIHSQKRTLVARGLVDEHFGRFFATGNGLGGESEQVRDLTSQVFRILLDVTVAIIERLSVREHIYT